jgi:cell division FtsZ-interacting protein ZapD
MIKQMHLQTNLEKEIERQRRSLANFDSLTSAEQFNLKRTANEQLLAEHK